MRPSAAIEDGSKGSDPRHRGAFALRSVRARQAPSAAQAAHKQTNTFFLRPVRSLRQRSVLVQH